MSTRPTALALRSALALTAFACGAGEPPGVPASVTYNQHVAALLHEHCAECHRPGEVAPFSLLSYSQARRKAKQIAEVTGQRIMPPWKPEVTDFAFTGERRLDPVAIATIARWVEQGAPEGEGSAPTPPVFAEGWRLGPPDRVVQMPEAFSLQAEGEDVFWNFVLPLDLDEPHVVRAVELRPGNREVVHHAEVRVDETRSSRELEARPGAGFPGTVEGSLAQSPLGHFVGWAPGRAPFDAGEGGGFVLRPGTDLVLELHMLPSGKPENVRASLGLFFSETPPREQPYLLRLGRKTLDIPAGTSDYVMEDSYTLPVPLSLRAVQPHAHFLGKQVEAEVVLPDGTHRTLLRIADWDFGWQDSYQYAEPVALPAGSRISARFVYDNTEDNPRNPAQPPRRVRYGPRSHDEMGDLWLQVVPDRAEDLLALRRERSVRELAIDRERYEAVVEAGAADAATHYSLGNALFRQGQLGESERHYREALRRDPGMARAHNDLGTVRVAAGDLTSAERHYREALALDPDSAKAQKNLANLMLQTQRFGAAEQALERVLALAPHDADAHNNLGGVLLLRERREQARVHFEAALRLAPDHPDAARNLERLSRVRPGPGG